MGKECRSGCKWCEKGECWSSGQVEKPEGFKHDNKKRKKGGGPGGQGAKGAGKAGKMQMMMQMMQQWYGGGDGGDAAASGGKKRKGETPEAQSSKSRLVQALALILGRGPTKADATWTVEKVDDKYVCSLVLTEMDKTFAGEPSASKKAAEHSAADAALEALSDQISTVEEEHKAKKAAKNKESLAALKLRTDEKKAAKKAEKEAAAEA